MRRRLFIVVLIGLWCAAPLAAESVTKSDDNLFVTEAVKEKAPMSSGRRLVINAASAIGGEIRLLTGGNNLQYEYVKRLKTTDRKEAEEYAEMITVEVETLKDVITLSLRAPTRVPWAGTSNSGRLAITITLPVNCAVECNTAYFDIEATGPFSGFVVSESLSKVTLDNVIGPTEVKVSNRSVIITNVSGELYVTNKYGKIRLEHINTGDEVGSVRNEHGEVYINDYQGGLDARTSYDKLIAQDIFLVGAKNRFKNMSDDITISLDSLTAGTVRINNNYGNVRMDIRNRVDGIFICKVDPSSAVTADEMDIVPILVDEGRLEFGTGGEEAEVRMTIRGSGDILIYGPGIDNGGGI